jgi:hypothetical protein
MLILDMVISNSTPEKPETFSAKNYLVSRAEPTKKKLL